MSETGLLTELGVNIKIAFTGAQGGLVGVFASGKVTLFNAIVGILSGAMTANALYPVFEPYFGKVSVAAAFIVGFGAIPICTTLLNRVLRRFNILQGTGK